MGVKGERTSKEGILIQWPTLTELLYAKLWCRTMTLFTVYLPNARSFLDTGHTLVSRRYNVLFSKILLGEIHNKKKVSTRGSALHILI